MTTEHHGRWHLVATSTVISAATFVAALALTSFGALYFVNSARLDERSDASSARGEVLQLQEAAACRDRLAKAVDLAVLDYQQALGSYILSLGQGGDNVAAITALDLAAAQMTQVRGLRAATEESCGG